MQGRPLPREASAGPAGVWVVGLSKGSEADRAGIEQGDQLLQVSAVAGRFGQKEETLRSCILVDSSHAGLPWSPINQL
jgi:hypothetical protein